MPIHCLLDGSGSAAVPTRFGRIRGGEVAPTIESSFPKAQR
jgi:hypothetical protein